MGLVAFDLQHLDVTVCAANYELSCASEALATLPRCHTRCHKTTTPSIFSSAFSISDFRQPVCTCHFSCQQPVNQWASSIVFYQRCGERRRSFSRSSSIPRFTRACPRSSPTRPGPWPGTGTRRPAIRSASSICRQKTRPRSPWTTCQKSGEGVKRPRIRARETLPSFRR